MNRASALKPCPPRGVSTSAPAVRDFALGRAFKRGSGFGTSAEMLGRMRLFYRAFSKLHAQIPSSVMTQTGNLPVTPLGPDIPSPLEHDHIQPQRYLFPGRSGNKATADNRLREHFRSYLGVVRQIDLFVSKRINALPASLGYLRRRALAHASCRRVLPRGDQPHPGDRLPHPVRMGFRHERLRQGGAIQVKDHPRCSLTICASVFSPFWIRTSGFGNAGFPPLPGRTPGSRPAVLPPPPAMPGGDGIENRQVQTGIRRQVPVLPRGAGRAGAPAARWMSW